jgi:hypothetical protein
VRSALGALKSGRRSPANQEDDGPLTDAQRLQRFDHGGEIIETVQAFIAAQANVSADVIASRGRIPVEERVVLNQGEFNGVQTLLTQRLRATLNAQDVARTNAYRFRAKVAQHIDLESAGAWSPERALRLLTNESLKLKEAYDQNLADYVEEISQRQEAARSAQERNLARQRLRTAFGGAHAGVRILRAAKATKAMQGPSSPRTRKAQEGGGGRRQSIAGGQRSSRESRESYR